jgi:hypothetical protein
MPIDGAWTRAPESNFTSVERAYFPGKPSPSSAVKSGGRNAAGNNGMRVAIHAPLRAVPKEDEPRRPTGNEGLTR